MRLLIIEDDHTIARALEKGLTREGFAVDLSFDGKEGLDFALGETYDAIILDWMLPGKSGLDIAREMRRTRNHTPILMLTAKGTTNDKVDGLNTGADDYLVKPFAFEELLARIRALMRREKQSQPVVLEGPNISLNTTTYEVLRHNQSIALTRREFALLEFLLRHKNKIVTKDQLINHIWNYDADVLPNTVEVYIGYLRQKLEKPFGTQQLIKTVRGFGYIIEEK